MVTGGVFEEVRRTAHRHLEGDPPDCAGPGGGATGRDVCFGSPDEQRPELGMIYLDLGLYWERVTGIEPAAPTIVGMGPHRPALSGRVAVEDIGVAMRLLSLLAAAGLVAGGAVAAAPAASAAGTCSMYVPSRFSIGQPFREITVPEGPNCAAAGVVDAYWLAYRAGSTDPVNGADYVDKARSTTVVLVDAMPIGRWTWQPDGAW